MKQFFTLFAISLTLSASAQTIGIYIEGEATDVSGTTIDLAGGEDINENLTVTNLSGGDLTLACTRTKLMEVSGATDYLCWGKNLLDGVCYSSSTVGPNNPWTTPDVFTWTDGEEGLLAVYHIANGNPGVALFRYYIVDDGTGDLLDSVDVRYTSTVGIEETKKLDISAYPNPANNVFNIELDGAGSDVITVQLQNLLGQKVIDEKISNGVNTLDVSKLKSGIYFYTISRNGNAVETKKLVIK